MSTDAITKLVDSTLFKNNQEFREIIASIDKILNSLSIGNVDDATTEVIKFLEQLWHHFSVEKYGEVFLEFAKIQKALYGLELTEEGGRYRDHVIHVFNVFLSGLVVISKIVSADKDFAWKLLKIKAESAKLPFPNSYNEPRRVYYLWSLVSTLHDIALPVQHKEEMIEGLRRFYGYFKIEAHDLPLRLPAMSETRVEKYIDLMGRMFENGIVLELAQGDLTYSVASESSPYFVSTLYELFDEQSHGILASYFLYKSIEEDFMGHQHRELTYDLDVVAVSYDGRKLSLPNHRSAWKEKLEAGSFPREHWNDPKKIKRIYDDRSLETKSYVKHVFEQDITRAALAIALHNISYTEHPKIFPIRFSKFPLSWLLILLDECQEYYRPEGLSLEEIIRFQDFPRIEVDVDRDRDAMSITISLNLKKPEQAKIKTMIERHTKWAQKNHETIVQTYEQLVRETWIGIFRTLVEKLSFEDKEPTAVRIIVTIEGKPPNGEALEFASSNWPTHN